jgi:hypothetical protein
MLGAKLEDTVEMMRERRGLESGHMSGVSAEARMCKYFRPFIECKVPLPSE